MSQAVNLSGLLELMSGQIDYGLIDCPWDDQELEAFFHMANPEMGDQHEHYYIDPTTLPQQPHYIQPNVKQLPPHTPCQPFNRHNNNQLSDTLAAKRTESCG